MSEKKSYATAVKEGLQNEKAERLDPRKLREEAVTIQKQEERRNQYAHNVLAQKERGAKQPKYVTQARKEEKARQKAEALIQVQRAWLLHQYDRFGHPWLISVVYNALPPWLTKWSGLDWIASFWKLDVITKPTKPRRAPILAIIDRKNRVVASTHEEVPVNETAVKERTRWLWLWKQKRAEKKAAKEAQKTVTVTTTGTSNPESESETTL